MQGYRIRHPDRFPVFAFRLHQFFSRGRLCSRRWSRRSVSPRPRSSSSSPATARALLPLAFCRECGQEYYSVRTAPGEQDSTVVAPRKLTRRERRERRRLPLHRVGQALAGRHRGRARAHSRGVARAAGRASAYGRTIASTSYARSLDPTGAVGDGRALVARSASASTAGFHTVAARRGTSGSCSPSGPAGARARRPSSGLCDPHAARRREEGSTARGSEAPELHRQPAGRLPQSGHFNDFVEVGLVRSAPPTERRSPKEEYMTS